MDLIDSAALTQTLKNFKHLEELLMKKKGWLSNQAGMLPEDNPNRLVQWLWRQHLYGDCGDLLEGIDRAIGMVQELPGMTRKVKTLRDDPPSFHQTCTEIFFVAWLKELELQVELPGTGADVRLELIGDHMPIEINCPKWTAWADDLMNRIPFLARRYLYSVRVDYGHVSHSGDAGIQDVQQLVERIRPQLVSADVPRQSIRECLPIVDGKMVWTPVDSSGEARTSIHSDVHSPGYGPGIMYLVTMANKKAGQLEPGHAGAVLIGAQHAPSDIRVVIDAHRAWPPEDLTEANQRLKDVWKELDKEVKWIGIYEPNYTRIQPGGLTWVQNPLSGIDDPDGWDATRAKLTVPPI